MKSGSKKLLIRGSLVRAQEEEHTKRSNRQVAFFVLIPFGQIMKFRDILNLVESSQEESAKIHTVDVFRERRDCRNVFKNKKALKLVSALFYN